MLSGDPTLEQLQQRSDYESFTPLTIGNHKGVRFLSVGDDKRLICGVAVEIPQGGKPGTVSFLVNTRLSVGKLGEPCDEAQRHATDFAKFLP